MKNVSKRVTRTNEESAPNMLQELDACKINKLMKSYYFIQHKLMSPNLPHMITTIGIA